MLALGLAGGLDLGQAAALANHAAAIIVQKPATAILHPEELVEFIRERC
jgi:bifunctional ADP-heptose synthase (sugar kinase/adenylyltransferase)